MMEVHFQYLKFLLLWYRFMFLQLSLGLYRLREAPVTLRVVKSAAGPGLWVWTSSMVRNYLLRSDLRHTEIYLRRYVYRSYILILATSVGAAPGITFPINSQVPPVAQVVKPFSFVFSSFTFTSNTPSINYIQKIRHNGCSWTVASRTLSGTPGSGDVGRRSLL
jgi:hypothetical protein